MKKNRILVAEDDYYLQRDLKELLTGQGYEVVSASSKQEAMQYILSDKNISLYLLDVWFDDGEGFALCEQIRKQSINPVLFLTVIRRNMWSADSIWEQMTILQSRFAYLSFCHVSGRTCGG